MFRHVMHGSVATVMLLTWLAIAAAALMFFWLRRSRRKKGANEKRSASYTKRLKQRLQAKEPHASKPTGNGTKRHRLPP